MHPLPHTGWRTELAQTLKAQMERLSVERIRLDDQYYDFICSLRGSPISGELTSSSCKETPRRAQELESRRANCTPWERRLALRVVPLGILST